MKKVIFYFDGFNFYNGLKAKSELMPHWKNYYWLDIVKFCEKFLDNSAELVCAKYFSAPPSNNDQRSRQSAFFAANKLLNQDKFHVINGNYQNKEIQCRAICKMNFQQPEEKRTDVAIATNMLLDCYQDSVDTLVLVSADSDQIPTIECIKKHFPDKKVKVYFPPERKSTELLNICKPVVFLGDNENKFKNSMMGKIVTNGTKTYTCPSNWKG